MQTEVARSKSISAEPRGLYPASHPTVPIAIWAVDQNGVVILSEGAALRSIGVRPGQLVGQSIVERFQDSPEVVDLVQSALAGQTYVESCHIGDVLFESRCAVLRDDAGKTIGAVAVSIERTPESETRTDTSRFEELYQQLLQPLPIITYIADCRSPHHRLYVSSQLQTLLGPAADSWLQDGFEWLSAVHPEDRQGVLSHLKQVATTDGIVENSFRLRHTSGKDVYVEERVAVIRAPDGTPLCLQGILLDVTARKLVETKSAQSDEHWRLIVESASDGIFTVGRDGRFDFVNARITEMLEIEHGDLLSRHFSEFLLPEDRERLIQRFENRMKGQLEAREYEVQWQTLRGKTFWSEVSLTPLKRGEQIHGSLAFVRDISERKQVENSLAELRSRLEQRVAERTRDMRLTNLVLEEQIEHARAITRQLQASEAKWRSLVEHAPQFVMLVDNEGRILFINRTAPGYEMENVIGARVTDLMPPHAKPITVRMLNRVFNEGVSETYEVEGYGSRANAIAWYSVSIGPILNRTGEPATTAVMIAADITERKATAEALQKRQRELAHISRMNTMGALTAELAHELNQPLEAISAYANGCLRSLNGDESQVERVEVALQSICLQSARAGQIIRKIMDYLRKGDSPRQLADINQLIREVVEFVELDARRHEVEIQCDLCETLNAVPVNRVQIEQVLFNLLFNAIEAVRSEPSPRRHIRVTSGESHDDEVEINVHDAGPGFDAARVDELFQPFFTTKTQGMGMGLSISRMIVDEHGGRIWASSEPGKGSTFTFVLPAGSQKNGD